jgi:hypothetical protein
VVVADLVNGPGSHRAGVHWHLDPGWTADLHGLRAEFTRADRDGARVGLVVPQGLLEQFSADTGTRLGWYSPVYGRLDRATTLRVSHDGVAPFWMISVFDFDSGNLVHDVDYVPVWAEAGVVAHATAIRITRAASIDHVLFAEPAAAESAPPPTWRVGELETDARMLFCRATAERAISCVALVDGSLVRVSGRRAFQLALPRREAAFFSDGEGAGVRDQGLAGTRDWQGSGIRD